MIDFVGAKNGGLEFTTICDTQIFGATLEECALIIAKQGLANRAVSYTHLRAHET